MTPQKLLFAGSTLLALLLGEWGLRVFFPTLANGFRLYRYMESEREKFCRYHEVSGWEGRPEAQEPFEWADTRCRVRQNKAGFRGEEYSQARGGNQRILVLGDSFVWGFGVEEEDIFTEVLRNASKRTIDIINMGVSGYGTDQNFLTWTLKGRAYKPGEVLLFVTLNTDLYDNLNKSRYGYFKPVFQFPEKGPHRLTNVPVPKDSPREKKRIPTDISLGLLGRTLHRSNLACLVLMTLSENKSLQALFENWELIPPPRAGYTWEHELYKTTFDKRYSDAWLFMSRLIELLNKDVRAQEARLTVVLVPSPIQFYPRLWKEFLAKAPPSLKDHLDPEMPNKEMLKIANRLKIPALDLLPELRKMGEKDHQLYFPINCHWTKRGHKRVAEILAHHMGLEK